MDGSSGGLRTIVVDGLFGSRNYEIPVEGDRPTVLTGANGTGKSTLLRLVNAASTGDLRVLSSAPLRRFELHFESVPPLLFFRVGENETRLEWDDHSATLSPRMELAELPDWAYQVVQATPQADDEDLEDALMSEARAAGVPFEEYRETQDLVRRLGPDFGSLDVPEWLLEFQSIFPVLFVTDQRLVVESKRRRVQKGRHGVARSSRLAVEAASAQIADQMRRVDSAYARVSQLQDRRFPRDVIQAMSDQAVVPLADLESLLEEVDRRRESLRAVGLLDREQTYEPDIAAGSLDQEQVRPVIATFLRATLEKLAVLEELSTRLSIFKSFLDERFAGKTMLAQREGIRFELDGGTSIRPSQLSSGEQQMMVLAYEILFSAREGTLVIVDEPEISLHVLWQDTLLDNLTDMGAASRLQFLMATHSPALLAAHPELERSLDLPAHSASVPAA